MAILNSPGLLREVTRQTFGEAVSTHARFRRLLDGSAQRTNVYLASWDAFQEAGLRGMLSLQDGFLQASQAMIEATLWATPFASASPPASSGLWPDPTLKLSRSKTQLLPGRPQPSAEDETHQIGEWADSALRFQSPLGSLFSKSDEPEDKPGPE